MTLFRIKEKTVSPGWDVQGAEILDCPGGGRIGRLHHFEDIFIHSVQRSCGQCLLCREKPQWLRASCNLVEAVFDAYRVSRQTAASLCVDIIYLEGDASFIDGKVEDQDVISANIPESLHPEAFQLHSVLKVIVFVDSCTVEELVDGNPVSALEGRVHRVGRYDEPVGDKDPPGNEPPENQKNNNRHLQGIIDYLVTPFHYLANVTNLNMPLSSSGSSLFLSCTRFSAKESNARITISEMLAKTNFFFIN